MATFRYDFRDSLEELRSRLVWRLCFVVVGFGIAATWYVLVRRDLPFAASGQPLLVIGLGLVVQSLTNRNPVLARHLLVWGIVAQLLIAMRVFPGSALPNMGIVCIFVNAMLIKNGGLLSAISVFAGAAILNWSGIRAYSLIDLAALLTLAAASSWLCAYTLLMVVHWYSAMQARSEQLLEITRDHRAELSRTLKSLEAAYEMQRHIQLELIWARQRADDARRLKEQFAANISHELRTPLSLILGFSEIMYLSPEVYGDMPWPPTLRRDIHQIYRSSQHLLAMIDDILDLSRFEMNGFNLTLEEVSLEPLLRDTVEIARDLVKGHRTRLKLEISPDLPIMDIDCTRIRQVILNLLNNACRFTEAGEVELAARQVGSEVLVSVSDTGTGIPANKLPYVFDEFYQVDHTLKRSHGGAGLGLAISKRFVEAHGGRIWVESREAVGSRFTFALPVTEKYLADRSSDGSQNRAPLPAARSNILVLEKDPAIVSMLAHYLKEYDLIQVRDVEALPEVILSSHARAIIRNVRPGHQTAAHSLVETVVPIIECSLPSLAWLAEDLAVSACLTIPITAQSLLDEINRLGHVEDILVIVHDRDLALLVERILQRSGLPFTVQRAYDVEQGVAMMRKRPDLVLLDTIMPGTEGFSTLEQMRSSSDLSGTPVILLNAKNYEQELRRDSQFAVHQRDGLYPTEILNGLNAIVSHLKPRYSALYPS